MVYSTLTLKVWQTSWCNLGEPYYELILPVQSLVNKVGVATNRPHLEAEIIQAILDATAWYHSLGEFPLDSYEGVICLVLWGCLEHTLDLGPLIPRLRSIREVAVYSQACARTLYVMKQVKSLRPLNCDEARITGTKVHVHGYEDRRVAIRYCITCILIWRRLRSTRGLCGIMKGSYWMRPCAEC